jgi:hypothetical protein
MYARAVLPLVAIVAYFGVQSENFAKPIGGLLSSALPLPPATGSIQLTICDFAEISCPFQSTQVQFPPDQVTKKIVKGSNSAAATINYVSSLSPSSSISARLSGYPASEDYVIFTYFFGFTLPPGVTAGIGPPFTGKINTSGQVSGGPSSLAQVRIFPQFQFNSPIFSDYACTATCSGLPLKGSFSDNKTLRFYAYTVYVLQMNIGLSFTNSTAGKTTATASIDPIITIDPQYASDFQLVLSPNLAPRRSH